MSNLRKAALFFLGLDLKTADLIMQRLDCSTAQAVRHEMLALQDTSPQEIASVSAEFVQNVNDRHVYQGRLPAALLQHKYPQQIDTVELSASIDVPHKMKPALTHPFAFLRSVGQGVLAKLVAGESSQTLALVMAHVPTDVARELLATFPHTQQIEAMRRMSLLGEIDTEVVRDVAEALQERLASLKNSGQAHDVVSVTSPMLIELASLHDDDLAETLRQVESCIVMVAIAGSDAAFVNRVLRYYTHAEQRLLEQRLDAMHPITPHDISKARLALGRALRQRRQNS